MFQLDNYNIRILRDDMMYHRTRLYKEHT